MKNMGWIAAAGLAAAVFALPAAAQMNPPSLSALYVGGEVGQGEQKFDCAGASPCDTKDTAWRGFVGYQFHRMFSVEAGYAALGTAKFGTTDVETKLGDLSVIGALPVGPVSLFLRLGGYYGKTEATGPKNKDNDKAGYLFGAGVGFDINKNIGLRGEWKRYDRIGGGALGDYASGDMLSIAALWRFQ